MAMTGVLRPGHAQIRVLDLDESIKWYTDVMGLVPMGKDSQGRAYFKARAERDHNSIILRQADRAGMDFFGFKVRDDATLQALEQKLHAAGVATERMPAGELLETGERVRFKIPTGHTIELYAEKKHVGNATGCLNPEVDVIDGPGICPIRLDHCLIYGGDIDGSRKLFEEVLGFNLVERVKLEDGTTDLATWLTCSTKAHDIAMVRHSEDDKLHHVSFQLGSWEQVLRAADIMSKNRVSIDVGPTRHGITNGTTIYFFDPSGNRLETFSGGYDHYPDMEPITWTWDEVGAGIFYHNRKLNDAFLSVVT
ncbi:catechol 2,3-dioxygenase [Ottowia sp.]|uniref:catechol 2,3-dioxygenase n=1 Tax=Ottowia sp. TaxID=1898956 RepID=UPI002C6C3AF2|nr:catechol 2,3-dioxygenase [Ottowia sp.]HRN75369.1 catechol 2,3-dioxygenase [Ottowia sp.]HRQ02787.1 catechol 2,3-dioxygenase [Ottowia sp.]